MSTRTVVVMLMTLATLALPAVGDVAFAANARISAIVAEVSHRVGPSGDFTASTVGAQLPAGSRVRTGARGKAEITFADGSTVRMGPRSDLVITDPNTKRVRVMAGQVFANIISGTGGAQIQGATATAAVRGTQVLVTVTEPSDSEEWVTVPEAEVAAADQSWEGLRTFGPAEVAPTEGGEPSNELTAAQMRLTMVALAKNHLAQHLGIEARRIYLASLERVTWPDSSLGFPQAGRQYEPVETPGYRMLLDTPEGMFTYAADESGRVISDTGELVGVVTPGARITLP